MRDLVVVGAGTAGCVLAERLTRSGRLNVLLVEAGGRPTNRFVGVPAGFTRLFRSEVDWAFESEPQRAVGDRRIFTPRGRMLGGSSNMNAQIHQWCHPADFDDWDAAGAHGWRWCDVEPFFRAQERWLGDDPDGVRGRDGPMTVTPNRNVRALSEAFVAAARAAGLGTQGRYNGGEYEGAWLCELAQKDGRRFSAYHACLEPAMRRPNLTVVTDAHATRIVLDGRRAVGIEVHRGGRAEVLHAGAVVLAAGAFGSPQLLMLSGIGPADGVATLGLPQVVDAREVGAHLQDHPVLPVVFGTACEDTLLKADSPASLLRYLVFRAGMLASSGIEAFAFRRTPLAARSAPDLEIMFMPADMRAEFLEPPRRHAFTLAPAVVAPRSRGRLRLRGGDPLAPPCVDFGLLSDADGTDRAVLLEGLRLCRRIAATPPLATFADGELRPGARADSDAALLEYAGATLQTVYHPSSTCRMGSDAGAVVDPQLAVRGLERLWVADASVMPTVPRGHPNAVVAMIAERASGWIEHRLVAG